MKSDTLSLDLIDPSPGNRPLGPDVAELAESIKRHGLLHPILVVDAGGGRWRIVAGHRRYAACQLLGQKTIDVRICDPNDDEDLIRAAENTARRDYSPAELCQLVADLLETRTATDVAAALGYSVSHIRNLSRVRLQLVDEGWTVFQAEGHKAMLSRWVQLAGEPPDVQRARLLGNPTKGASVQTRKRPTRSQIVARRRKLPADDLRAKTLAWVLGEGAFPD